MSTPRIFLLNLKRTVKLRSCFKFIPRQIEAYVEADWSPRYAVNSGLLTKIKGFKMRDWAQYGRNIPACNDNIISQ